MEDQTDGLNPMKVRKSLDESSRLTCEAPAFAGEIVGKVSDYRLVVDHGGPSRRDGNLFATPFITDSRRWKENSLPFSTVMTEPTAPRTRSTNAPSSPAVRRARDLHEPSHLDVLLLTRNHPEIGIRLLGSAQA